MKFPQFINRWLSRRRCPRRRQAWEAVRPVSVSMDTLENRLLLTLDIQWDYTYDTNGFFNSQESRDVLEAAAAVFESRITDDLTAIIPSGNDNWTATFNHPGTNAELAISSLSIPTDTIIIYAGGRDTGNSLALGGVGARTSSFGASQTFGLNMLTRGESGIVPGGATDTDFAPWGGTLTVNSTANWNLTMDLPTTTQNDLYSVALHEVAHILGFGTSPAFTNSISGTNFTGAATTSTFGGPVPLSPDRAHVASDTMGTVPGTSISQEALLDPQIVTGTRKLLTDLDWAILDDIGWDIAQPPVPVDYGDAPDFAEGTSFTNYETRLSENGPRHTIVDGLFIGDAAPDGDAPALIGGLGAGSFNADDRTGIDDEGFPGADLLAVVQGAALSMDVTVTNTTGTTATLHGWVDYNSNGQFETSERASAFVPSGTVGAPVTLNFPAAGDPDSPASFLSYARFRLSTDSAAASPVGPASDGEVEDYSLQVYSQVAAYDSLPSFNWPEVSGASRYEVEVDNLTTGESQILVDSHIIGTGSQTVTFRAREAFAPGTYRWRYRPFVGSGFQPFSAYITFVVFETVGTPVITDPLATSVDSLPTFAWSPVEGAIRYELWVNGGGKQRTIHQTNLANTSFTSLVGLAEGSYTAWVRAYGPSGPLGVWSEPHQFSVAQGTLSLQAQVTDPGIGTSINTLPTIAWRPTGGTSHRVTITNVDSQEAIVDADNVTGTHFTPTEGLPPGNYIASVFVNGLTGSVPTIGFISPTFRIEEVIGQAELTVPYGNSENPVPAFGWTAVSGANRYELWVDDVTRGISRIIHSSSLTGTSYQTVQPLPSGNYRAWVRAFNRVTGIGTWSQQVDFRVTQSSGVPTVWSPINTTLNTAPTFAWSSVENASTYQLQLHQNGVEQLNVNGISDNVFTLNTALAPGEYTVTITVAGGLQDSRTFVVSSTSRPVEVFAPTGETANTRPTFSWASIESATRYFVWVNDDTRNISGTILESEVKTTTLTPNKPLLPGNYRVWVRAYNGAAPVTGWSEASSFTVTETSGPPAVTAPLYQTTSTVPNITWTAVTGSTTYDVEIFNANPAVFTVNPIVSASGIPITAYVPDRALVPGDYYVRVRSVDTGGTPSAWSETNSFSIQPTVTPSLVYPDAGSSVLGTDLFLAWTAVQDVARYELWVNRVDTNTVQIYYETALTELSFTPGGTVAPGHYRAWVRAIDSSDAAGPWSPGLDFMVTATDTNVGSRNESDLSSQMSLTILPTLLDSSEILNEQLGRAVHVEAVEHSENVHAESIKKSEAGNDSTAKYDEQLLDAVLAMVDTVLA